MESIFTHVNTRLNTITKNTGTEEEPVLVKLLKEIAQDDGQLDEKVTLKLPAAYYDITNMAYSQAGELIGVADTEITLKLAFKKNDPDKYSLIKAVKKSLIGTKSDNFSSLSLETFQKVSYDDIFEYRMTFGCIYYDEDAIPEYIELTDEQKANIDPDITYNIK